MNFKIPQRVNDLNSSWFGQRKSNKNLTLDQSIKPSFVVGEPAGSLGLGTYPRITCCDIQNIYILPHDGNMNK